MERKKKGLRPQMVQQSTGLLLVVLVALLVTSAAATEMLADLPQQRRNSDHELVKLREQFIRATREFTASLEKLIKALERSREKAEVRAAQSRELYTQGLISRKQLEETETALASLKDKINEAQKQMATAETQIAATLVEADAEAKMAKLRLRKGGYVSTVAYIRFNGTAAWGLPEAGKVQRFFLDTFKKQLPVAVFGQGAIHERWRLDHRNAMDISLHPDGVEGQTLIDFLRRNGIPFSAFRTAVPGTATGPHIHIGRPSHRF